jgi:hypothetical protein
MNNEIFVLQAKLAAAETNHILHLILSVLTFGIWVVVWILVTLNNKLKRNSIRRALRKI